MNERRDLVVGFLLGSALGLAVGLLVAPAPGREVRARLKREG